MDFADSRMIKRAAEAVSPEARQLRMPFLILGVALIALGITAAVFPLTASLGTEMFVGTVLLISGLLQILHALGARNGQGFLLSVGAGVLAVGVGVTMMFYPFSGILALNLLTAGFLAGTGVLRVLLALQLRPADHWAWLLGSGIVALILAAVILPQWPLGAAWIFGLIIGIDLVFAGWVSLVLASAAHRTALAARVAAV